MSIIPVFIYLRGCLIRQDKNIRGLKVHDIEIKISQYADDTTIFFEPDESNLKHCVKIVDDFKGISGLKINIENCNIIRLGNFKEKLCRDIPFTWPSDYFMYLGVKIPITDTLNFNDLNFKPKLEDIKSTLNVWNCRTLTMYGKIVIIKTLIISKLTYLLSTIPNLPESFLTEVQ